MSVNWNDIKRIISPIKNYEELCRRWRESFSYAFVCETFDFSMPQLVHYTQLVLEGDARGRYIEYAAMLKKTFIELDQAGVRDVLDLLARVETRKQFEIFVAQSGVRAQNIATGLKYLAYWFIPTKKYLSGLVKSDPATSKAILALRGLGIRTNLDLIQRGLTAAERKALADSCSLPEAVISDLVNRADFSRMPWASKATISNIIGAGYGSMAKLANANPEKLYADFFKYGKAIGKNLKLGNEIENSHRIAKIVPALLRD
jgi:hypothetical protein